MYIYSEWVGTVQAEGETEKYNSIVYWFAIEQYYPTFECQIIIDFENMKQNHRLSKPGKLKFKSTFQEKIDRHTEKMLQDKQRELQAKQYEQLFKQKLQAKEHKEQFPVMPGTGKIATSGKSIHGVDTHFKQQLQKGDHIILTHPTLHTKQQKPICLILSDKSILLDEPFVDEQTAFGPFQYRKQTLVKPAEDLESEYKKRLEEIHRTKKIQKEKQVMEVRTKKGIWSYETTRHEVGKDATREEMLMMRMKLGKDKHCW